VKRIVQPEILDTLPPDDPRAVRSRRDLRHVNGWMRNHAIMADAVQNAWNRHAPGHIIELGAGDGHFLLRVAQRLGLSGVPRAFVQDGPRPERPAEHVTATLLDRQNTVSAETLGAFAARGWRAEPVVADVFDWPQTSDAGKIVIANLFLHHFEEARLRELFQLISQRAQWFIAIEPQRARGPLFCSRLLGAMGCNDVTRHDARASVRAGFSDHELSAAWPDPQNWQLAEHRAGAFSHLFIARKLR
jgi:hypothetical protein